MYFTDHSEQFNPSEAEYLDALQAIWESEAYESIRKAEIRQILHPQWLILCGVASTPESTHQVA